MTNRTPEGLDGPLFPRGIEGNDESLDQGTYTPRTDDERQLFRAFDVRQPRPKSAEWYVEQFRAEGAVLARALESIDSFEGIRADLTGRDMLVEKRTQQTSEGLVDFVVAWQREKT